MVNVILIMFLVVQNLVTNVSDSILEEERNIFMKMTALFKKGYFEYGRNNYQKYSLVCGIK